MSQTMLLTKPLAVFLSQSTSSQLHTLLLLSPSGKLLSSSSSQPASTLRTQATLAVSLWSLYNPFDTTAALISTSLSSTRQGPSTSDEQDLSSITIQFEHGIMNIRALVSGLLFVAIGPGSSATSLHHSSQARPSALTSSPSSIGQIEHSGSQLSLHGNGEGISAAASDAGSIRSVGGPGTSIWGFKRRAGEVGELLEERLKGFVLGGEMVG